jgi:hypothetical protein
MSAEVKVKTDEKGRFLKGTKPGPGRPQGSTRSERGPACVRDLHEAWQAKGKAAIATVVAERPHEFLKVVAGLLPKDINVKVDQLSAMDDSELAASLAALRSLANTCSAEIARAGAIEAESAEHADEKAAEIGIYFNGCDDGRDCPCCGDRWYEARHKGVNAVEVDQMWDFHWHDTVYVHRADGSIERLKKGGSR